MSCAIAAETTFKEGGDTGVAALGNQKSHSGLEFLRFSSAFCVLMWHYQHFYMVNGENLPENFNISGQPFYFIFEYFYNYGYMSVSIFWQISGFIFFWKYHEAIHSARVTAWPFFALRFSRLYPLHVATLMVVAILQLVYGLGHGGESFVYGHNDPKHFALGLAFASNWGFEDGLSFNGPIWSVSTEVVVYAFFFAVSRRLRLATIGRLVAIGALATAWLINDRLGGPATLRVMLSCSVYFFSGGLVQAIESRLPQGWAQWSAPGALAAAAMIAATMFQPVPGPSKVVLLAFSTLTIFGFLGLERWPVPDRAMTLVAPLADTTYSSYLLHFPLQIIMVTITDGIGLGRDVYDHPLLLVIFLGSVFGLGWLVYQRFERPAQVLLRRWMLPSKPSARAAPRSTTPSG